jgi:hypothetical protein
VTLSPSGSLVVAAYPVALWPRVHVAVALPGDVNDGGELRVAVTDVPEVDWMPAEPGCR